MFVRRSGDEAGGGNGQSCGSIHACVYSGLLHQMDGPLYLCMQLHLVSYTVMNRGLLIGHIIYVLCFFLSKHLSDQLV